MRKRIIAATVAGGLLIGAGFVTSAVSAPGTAAAQDDSSDTDAVGTMPRILGFFQDLLDQLVGDGTITQDQADAIADAAQEKAGQIRDEREAMHELMQQLLEDGVITEEEAAQLPDDHPFFDEAFDEAWSDGELTIEEIRSIAPSGPRHKAFRRGFRLGSLLDDGGIDQSEYDALPEDHILKQVDVSDYLADGLITPNELREILSDQRSSSQT